MKQTPPLLQFLEGRRVRPCKAPVVRPKEVTLHMSVAKLLRDHARPDWLWSHFPAGELRHPRVAVKLKQMGTKAGWPDFVLVDPQEGRLHGLELKRLGQDLNDSQEEFQRWCIVHGAPYSVARSIDEVLAVLDAWGCLRITIKKQSGIDDGIVDNIHVNQTRSAVRNERRLRISG